MRERKRESKREAYQSNGGDEAIKCGKNVKDPILPHNRFVYLLPPTGCVSQFVGYNRRKFYSVPPHPLDHLTSPKIDKN